MLLVYSLVQSRPRLALLGCLARVRCLLGLVNDIPLVGYLCLLEHTGLVEEPGVVLAPAIRILRWVTHILVFLELPGRPPGLGLRCR